MFVAAGQGVKEDACSALFAAKVMHARLQPSRHDFSYNVYTYAFDVDQLPVLNETLSGFGHNRFALASLHDSDFLTRGNKAIRSKVEEYLQSKGYAEPVGTITLVSSPRYFGYVFNPVSFYFCYDRVGALAFLIVEVNNTYSERHLYLLPLADCSQKVDGSFHIVQKKDFHVSPFFSLDYDYEFSFHDIRDKLDIRINLLKEGRPSFVSRVSGARRTLNSRNHWQMVVKYPLRPAMTMPLITWQAVKLITQRRLRVLPKPNPSSVQTIRTDAYSWVDQLCIGFLKRALKGVTRGKLILRYPDNREEYYGDLASSHPVLLKLNNFKVFRKVVFGGSIGLGESFVEGDWETPDLSGVLKLFLNNHDSMAEGKLNAWKPTRFFHWLEHKLRSNSLIGSHKNISAHYDLSNEMFALFLDPSMMYSSAKFNGEEVSLEAAQYSKIRAILDKAGVKAGQHILEIGSGWGTCAITAAKEYGAKVTSLTLSKEQKAFAEKRAQEAGVAELVSFQLCDYRHAVGQYDHIVSIEMLEAVGHEHLDAFVASCERLLKHEGKLVLQFIAYPDFDYARYRKRQDWIQKYIFPGSHLPSLSALLESAARSSKFVVEHVEDLALDYAKTLKIWRERFNARLDEVRTLQFDDKFINTWNFYLASCEAEFATRWLCLYQIALTRPNNQTQVA